MKSSVTISLVPEACGGPFVYWDDLAAGCAQAAALGFDAVEIFPRAAANLDARSLRSLLAQHRLKLAAVGTGAGWVVHRLRLTDPDAAIRVRARAFVADLVDLAGEFGAPAIIGSIQGRCDGQVSREQALTWLREAMEDLGPRAQAHGVPLLFEPLNRYETNLVNTVAEGLTLLQSLGTENVKLLCDLFHMNLEEVSLADALRAAGPRLGHVHFADSNRHAIGFGHTDLAPVAKALHDFGYTGYLSAEILPLPDSDAAAKQTMVAYRSVANRADRMRD
jgi:sugar phosphate isomerase/epimerase